MATDWSPASEGGEPVRHTNDRFVEISEEPVSAGELADGWQDGRQGGTSRCGTVHIQILLRLMP
jgi:hypothetical protein